MPFVFPLDFRRRPKGVYFQFEMCWQKKQLIGLWVFLIGHFLFRLWICSVAVGRLHFTSKNRSIHPHFVFGPRCVHIERCVRQTKAFSLSACGIPYNTSTSPNNQKWHQWTFSFVILSSPKYIRNIVHICWTSKLRCSYVYCVHIVRHITHSLIAGMSILSPNIMIMSMYGLRRRSTHRHCVPVSLQHCQQWPEESGLPNLLCVRAFERSLSDRNAHNRKLFLVAQINRASSRELWFIHIGYELRRINVSRVYYIWCNGNGADASCVFQCQTKNRHIHTNGERKRRVRVNELDRCADTHNLFQSIDWKIFIDIPNGISFRVA